MRNTTGTNKQEAADLASGSIRSKDSAYALDKSSVGKDRANSQFKTDIALTNDKSRASFYEPDTPVT